MTTDITWKRYNDYYAGSVPETNDYYAVSRPDRWWQCWHAGQYLGSFRTMREAKAAAEMHRALAVQVQDVDTAREMAMLEHLARGYSLVSTLRVVTVSSPIGEPENLPYEPENLPYEPILCGWFVMCDNVANGTAKAGPLGDVPICDRCRKIVDGFKA